MPMSQAQKIEVREREAKVLALRKAGATYAGIAEAVGYADASGAKLAFDRAMRATIQDDADEIRKLEVERLDSLLRALWPAAVGGKWLAVDRCLSIMERRSKLLGLDAPTRQMVTVLTEDVVDAALREAAEEHARLTAPDPARSTA